MNMVLSMLTTALFCVLASGNKVTVSFDQYAAQFARTYVHKEYEMRKSLFDERVAWIDSHNSNPKKLWTAGLNHLTDRTEDELGRMRGWTHSGNSLGRKAASLLEESDAKNTEDLLQEIDWTNLTAQKNGKDQGSCGSCWAVAAASLLEAHYEIHMGSTRTMSAQEFVNCVPNPRECGGTGGCKGATVELAVDYALKHGIATIEDVSYKGRDEQCRHDSLVQESGTIHRHLFAEDGSSIGLSSWSTLAMNKAEPLLRAMAHGPVAVSVGADGWFFYETGVYNSCDKDAVINHAVLLVGYGTDAKLGENYWKIQNSWGGGFGEAGYMRLHRHKTAAEDSAFCGIDHKPGDGIECKPYPDTVPVCGQCGILYDSVAPAFTRKKATLQQSLRGVIHKVTKN